MEVCPCNYCLSCWLCYAESKQNATNKKGENINACDCTEKRDQRAAAEHKSVTITDLAARLNVTKETIRRDLRAMEEDGELIRTHGGAYILEGVQTI